MICECGSVLEQGKARCSRCGRWQVSRSEVEKILQTTVCLADVAASDVDRIKSGPWDVAWGGGIVRDTVTMISGWPGAGKSTALLQLAAALSEVEQKNVLYIA